MELSTPSGQFKKLLQQYVATATPVPTPDAFNVRRRTRSSICMNHSVSFIIDKEESLLNNSAPVTGNDTTYADIDRSIANKAVKIFSNPRRGRRRRNDKNSLSRNTIGLLEAVNALSQNESSPKRCSLRNIPRTDSLDLSVTRSNQTYTDVSTDLKRKSIDLVKKRPRKTTKISFPIADDKNLQKAVNELAEGQDSSPKRCSLGNIPGTDSLDLSVTRSNQTYTDVSTDLKRKSIDLVIKRPRKTTKISFPIADDKNLQKAVNELAEGQDSSPKRRSLGNIPGTDSLDLSVTRSNQTYTDVSTDLKRKSIDLVKKRPRKTTKISFPIADDKNLQKAVNELAEGQDNSPNRHSLRNMPASCSLDLSVTRSNQTYADVSADLKRKSLDLVKKRPRKQTKISFPIADDKNLQKAVNELAKGQDNSENRHSSLRSMSKADGSDLSVSGSNQTYANVSKDSTGISVDLKQSKPLKQRKMNSPYIGDQLQKAVNELIQHEDINTDSENSRSSLRSMSKADSPDLSVTRSDKTYANVSKDSIRKSMDLKQSRPLRRIRINSPYADDQLQKGINELAQDEEYSQNQPSSLRNLTEAVGAEQSITESSQPYADVSRDLKRKSLDSAQKKLLRRRKMNFSDTVDYLQKAVNGLAEDVDNSQDRHSSMKITSKADASDVSIAASSQSFGDVNKDSKSKSLDLEQKGSLSHTDNSSDEEDYAINEAAQDEDNSQDRHSSMRSTSKADASDLSIAANNQKFGDVSKDAESKSLDLEKERSLRHSDRSSDEEDHAQNVIIESAQDVGKNCLTKVYVPEDQISVYSDFSYNSSSENFENSSFEGSRKYISPLKGSSSSGLLRSMPKMSIKKKNSTVSPVTSPKFIDIMNDLRRKSLWEQVESSKYDSTNQSNILGSEKFDSSFANVAPPAEFRDSLSETEEENVDSNVKVDLIIEGSESTKFKNTSYMLTALPSNDSDSESSSSYASDNAHNALSYSAASDVRVHSTNISNVVDNITPKALHFNTSKKDIVEVSGDDNNEASTSTHTNKTSKFRQMSMREFLIKLQIEGINCYTTLNDKSQEISEAKEVILPTHASKKERKRVAKKLKEKQNIKNVPIKYNKLWFTHFAKHRASKKVINAVHEIVEKFYDNLFTDLGVFVTSRNGSTLTFRDMKEVFNILDIASDERELDSLILKYLDLEAIERLIPCKIAKDV